MNKFMSKSLPAAILILSANIAIADARDRYAGTPSDFMEISQLFARYNSAVDIRDGRAWASTFTSDGIFQDTRRCVVGRSALENLVGSTPSPGRDRERFHMQMIGPIVYESHTKASVRSPILVIDATADEKTSGRWTAAVADDRLERIDGNWLIAHRIVYVGSEPIASTCR